VAELSFLSIFNKIASRLSVFKNENDFLANFEVLPREVAVAVKNAHPLVCALVLLSAYFELTGDPRSQAISILHSPSLAPPRDIMLMMIREELLLDIENELLQSIHAIGAPFRS